MKTIPEAIIVERLAGIPLQEWDFFGQCYTPREGHSRVCAVTLIDPDQSTPCFTIKPKSGVGRQTISIHAIRYFKKANPVLHAKLSKGLGFLRLRTEEVNLQTEHQNALKRMRAAEKVYKAAMSAAKKRLRKSSQTLNNIIELGIPNLDAKFMADWYENMAITLNSLQPEVVTIPVSEPVNVPANIVLEDFEEIDFDA